MPGNDSTDGPDIGPAGPAAGVGGGDGNGSTTPGGNGNRDNGGPASTPSGPGGESSDSLDGDEIVAIDPVSYSAVVTHNDDGSFSVDIYEDDGTGNVTKVSSETYTDTDGDGTYRGTNGGSSSGKPAEGTSCDIER